MYKCIHILNVLTCEGPKKPAEGKEGNENVIMSMVADGYSHHVALQPEGGQMRSKSTVDRFIAGIYIVEAWPTVS